MENRTYDNGPLTGTTYQGYGSMQTANQMMSSGSTYAAQQKSNGNYFLTADDYLQQHTMQYNDVEAQQMLGSARPTDPAIGELAPVGDMVLPMLVFITLYTVVKTLKKSIISRK